MAIETLNPATGELLKTFPEMEPAEVERILTAAVAAQRDWARVETVPAIVEIVLTDRLLKE